MELLTANIYALRDGGVTELELQGLKVKIAAKEPEYDAAAAGATTGHPLDNPELFSGLQRLEYEEDGRGE